MDESNYWTRLNRKRISRRTLIGAGGTVALGGAAALMVGCGGGGNDDGDDGGPTRTPATSPVQGGTITQGRAVTVLGIDPHLDLTGLDIDTFLYPYMYTWAPGAEEVIFNNLAKNLEQPDPLTFIFTLNQGFKQAPHGLPGENEEITSEDCKASFVRRGTSITAPDKRFPQKIAGSLDPAILEAALQTPDPYTFSFTMTEPFVPGVREMANPTWGIVGAKVLDARLGKGLSQVAFGAGPFMLEEFAGNERIVLKRNPNYFHQGKPYLDGLTYVIITENSSLLSAFEQGQHDVNGSVLLKDKYEEWSDDDRFVTSSAPSLFYPVIHLNLRRAPFDDIKVRQAINIAVDRDQIIDLVFGGEGNYNGPIQWPQTKWALPQEELRAFYKKDVAKAKELMASAGYEGGFSVAMKTPRLTGVSFVNQIARIIQTNLAEINIDMQIDEVELGSFITGSLLPGNFDMIFFPNLPYDEPDRPLAFYHSLGVTGTGNWTGYNNQDLDALINAQAREFEEPARQAIVEDAQRLILEEHGPQLTLSGGYQYSAHWDYVHYAYELGQDPKADLAPFAAEVWTEKVS